MRWIVFWVLAGLASSGLQAAIPTSLQQQIEQQQLHRHNHWLKLLHFRDGESEIDDPRFFLASDGKTDPYHELLATIEQLIADRSDTDQSLYCRFISRSSWLVQQLPELVAYLRVPRCQALQQELQTLRAHRVTLVLASAHINSPASAFGHTFLRIDSKEDTPLVSYAVSYAAETNETNGFVYAYRGIFGGYNGKYSILPYYEKIKEYNDLEQRDIWEYELNLTPQQIQTMVLHIMEIRQFSADYFFFSENCSYNILWLLEVARDDIDLTSQFGLSAIPIDTLRAVDAAGLVTRDHYRPSARKQINARLGRVEDKQTLQFVLSQEHDLTLLDGLSKAQRSNALELAVGLLQLRQRENEIERTLYSRRLLKLLRERSRLGLMPKLKIPRPASPLQGHLSRRLSLGWQRSAGENSLLLGIKPAYHDSADSEYGYLSGAFISFAEFILRANDQGNRLEQLKLVDIQSYALQDRIFRPISWQVDFGLQRPFYDRLMTALHAGAGKTFGREDRYAWLLLRPGVYADRGAFSASLAVRGGVAANWRRHKFSLGYELEKFDTHQLRRQLQAGITYFVNNTLAGRLSWEKNRIVSNLATQQYNDHRVTVSMQYYF